MFEETLGQMTSPDNKVHSSRMFRDVLVEKGIIIGIKVDKGVVPLHKFGENHNETVTTGLDGLGERLQSYFKLGCRFTKWRVIAVKYT